MKEFEQLVDKQVYLLCKAREKLLKQLEFEREQKGKIGLVIKSQGGKGVNTKQNDRRLYVWIECVYMGKEYCINLFESEIDYRSGNCHCQIGKVKFTKGYINNSKNACSSPNEIIKSQKDNLLTNENSTYLIFNSWKWINPLSVLEDNEIDVSELSNGKWITVDDILENEETTKYIVKAFLKFIEEDDIEN